MKICTKCKIEKNESEFSFKNKSLGKLSSNCKDCQKIMKDNHYRNNKDKYLERFATRRSSFKEWFADYKLTLKCEECGENHPATLDFHHENPNEKEYGISQMVHLTCSKNKIIEEISKCKVLCANCHRKVHYKE